MVCSAERCIDLIHGIMNRRIAGENDKYFRLSRPIFVWEPMPDLCTPEHIDSFRQAIQEADIVSPNAEELAGFFIGQSKSQEEMAAQVIDWGIGPSNHGLLVVREGKDGCSAYPKGHRIHLRAYHIPNDELQSDVVDPTGGGNAFLGALAMALSGDVCPQIVDACRMLALDEILTLQPVFVLIMSLVYATIAASFIIEQPGMPTYRTREDECETWNGEDFGHRLKAYLSREKSYLTAQMEREAQRDK
jgi:sugar/nucleoside kinase (ribokinase family)